MIPSKLPQSEYNMVAKENRKTNQSKLIKLKERKRDRKETNVLILLMMLIPQRAFFHFLGRRNPLSNLEGGLRVYQTFNLKFLGSSTAERTRKSSVLSDLIICLSCLSRSTELTIHATQTLCWFFLTEQLNNLKLSDSVQ